jgi:hypothetical protein
MRGGGASNNLEKRKRPSNNLLNFSIEYSNKIKFMKDGSTK